jgi:hypothetical protein
LLWLGRGRIVALPASAIFLAGSLLTMDVALPAVPFLVGLCAWLGRRRKARLAGLLAAWGIVLMPVAVVEWSFLHDATSYAAMSLLPLSPRAFVGRAAGLWLEHFAPWRWPFARTEWYTRPAAVIPSSFMAVGALFAAALFLWRLCAHRDKGEGHGSRSLGLVALFAMMALAADAVYSRVWFSELFYRAHILSRVWASVAIGIFAGWAAQRWPRLRWGAAAGATVFVAMGAWGGIERQDFFLASWQGHQRELASILTAAPALRPGTAVILRANDTGRRYLATEADYLTQHWLRLLYDDPRVRSLHLDPERGAGCVPGPSGLDCWLEGQAACFAARTCTPTRFAFEELVLLDYDWGSGTYRLVRSLRGDRLARGHEDDAERYHPEDRIVSQPMTSKQRRLLLAH